MTNSDTEPSHCNACGSDQIQYWERTNSWICDECSYVLSTSGVAPDSTSPNSVPSFRGRDDSSTDSDWRDGISVKDNSEAILVEVLSQVDEIANELSFSSEDEIRTGEIVTKAWETNFMHGRSKEDTVAAAIYIVSRESGCTVPPGVIAEAANTDKSAMKNTYTQLKKKQNVELDPPRPEEYVEYICTSLDLSTEVWSQAEKLLENSSIAGNPVGIAAAAVYQSGNQQCPELTMRDIAGLTKITKETVWRQSKKFD